MDMTELRAHAETFARAIVTDNRKQISNYLTARSKTELIRILTDLPRVVEAKLLFLSSAEDNQVISFTTLCARSREVGLLAVWIENDKGFLISGARLLRDPSGSHLDRPLQSPTSMRRRREM